MALLLVSTLGEDIIQKYNSTENTNNRTLKLSENLENQRIANNVKEEKSFMSKLASWLFPFGGADNKADDTIAAETNSRAQYLPPTQGRAKCNPCNSVPWVPMASKQNGNTVLHFKPPTGGYPSSSSHSSNYNTHSLIPPQSFHREPQAYDGPPPPSNAHEAPPHISYGGPSQQYGPPQSSSHETHPDNMYGAPSQQYGPPPSDGHGDSPLNTYIAPPQQHAPAPSDTYGAPTQNTYNTHQEDYRPPPPPNTDQFISASQNSPPKDQVLLPPIKYNVPFKTEGFNLNKYVTPKPLKYVPVKVQLELGPQPPSPGPPIIYGPPVTLSQIKPLNYKPVFLEFGGNTISAPSSNGGLYHQTASLDNQGAPTQLIGNLPFYMLPPQPHQPNYYQQLRPVAASLRPAGKLPNKPIPLTNLSLKPVVPIYNPQNFQHGFKKRPSFDNIPQQISNVDVHPNSNHDNIQIIPSIPVAGYLASIEHPVNVIQSPLVEVTVKNQEENKGNQDSKGTSKAPYAATSTEHHISSNVNFNENPIVVPDDVHVAETSQNNTYQSFENSNYDKRGNDQYLGISNFNAVVNRNNQSSLTNLDKWTAPTLSSSMVPPPLAPSPWLNSQINYFGSSTTKRPKHIQVIVPYITNQKPKPFGGENEFSYTTNQGRKVPSNVATVPYKTLVNTFTRPPSHDASVWTKFAGVDSQLSETQTRQPTTISNIRDLLKGETGPKIHSSDTVPFDVINLQKAIDDWTQQEFSNKVSPSNGNNKATTSSKLVQSKKIPNQFLTTQPYVTNNEENTTVNNLDNTSYDHIPSSSNTKETAIKKEVDDVETNLITVDTTTLSSQNINETSTTQHSHFTTKHITWDTTQVAVSPVTKEKVYVVTPQPWKPENDNSTEGSKKSVTYNQSTFTIRLDAENETETEKNSRKVIYSEWPHLSKLHCVFLKYFCIL